MRFNEKFNPKIISFLEKDNLIRKKPDNDKNLLINKFLLDTLGQDENIQDKRIGTYGKVSTTVPQITQSTNPIESPEYKKLQTEAARINDELRVAKSTIADLTKEIGTLRFKLMEMAEREAAIRRLERLLEARDATIRSLNIRIEDLLARTKELEAQKKSPSDPKGSFKNLGLDPQIVMEIYSLLGPEGVVDFSGRMKRLLGTTIHPDKFSSPDKKDKATQLLSKANGAADMDLNDPAKVVAWYSSQLARKRF